LVPHHGQVIIGLTFLIQFAWNKVVPKKMADYVCARAGFWLDQMEMRMTHSPFYILYKEFIPSAIGRQPVKMDQLICI
jgi:hypothetical protein